MAAGKFGGLFAEPGVYAEIVGHFRNAAADYLGGHSKIFKAKGKFMPDLIGDYLGVRALHNESDFRGGFCIRNIVYIFSAEFNASFRCAERAKLGLKTAQKSRLSAAGRAAYYNEFSFIHGEIYIFKGRLTAKGIFKAKAVYFNCFHFRSSFN